jgi:hypothetical protein
VRSFNPVKASSVIEVISAFHLTKYVDHSQFSSRGGIFLIAPPGSLKSSLIGAGLEGFPDALQLSDLNVNTLSALKQSLIDQRWTTVAFGEYEKLYQRNPGTAANIEGHLKAMVEEGFGKESFTDQRMMITRAFVGMIGGVTPSCYQRMFTRWMENGFLRRFLWCQYIMADSEAIMNAIHKWKPLSFGKIIKEVPANGKIPYSISSKESLTLRNMIKSQPAHESPYIIIKKIFCVLKWRRGAKKAMEILEDFSEGLREGAKLQI